MAAASDDGDGRWRRRAMARADTERNQKSGRGTAGTRVITQSKSTHKGSGKEPQLPYLPLEEGRRGGIYTQGTVDTTSNLCAK